MKAFLSNRAARDGLIAGYSGDLRGFEHFTETMSMNEAGAILSRAEHGDGGHYSPVNGWRDMGEVWLSGAPCDGNAHAAIAEALAAFLASEVQA
jgi:hypothetical protein